MKQWLITFMKQSNGKPECLVVDATDIQDAIFVSNLQPHWIISVHCVDIETE